MAPDDGNGRVDPAAQVQDPAAQAPASAGASAPQASAEAPANKAKSSSNRSKNKASKKARKKFKKAGGQEGAKTRAKAEKTPDKLLEANTNAALAYADSITRAEDPKQIDLRKNANQVRKLVFYADTDDSKKTIGELTKAIAKLDEIKDNRIGIVWHESPELLDANGNKINVTRALVRDARNVEIRPEILRQEAPEKYAIQILNQTRAAIDLIDKDDAVKNKAAAKKALMLIANEAMQSVGKQSKDGVYELNSSTVKNYNQRTLDVLQEAGVQEAPERLNFAKEIVGLGKDEHRHIVTLTTAKDKGGQNHTVIEADIMLNGLTWTQKDEYERIAKLFEQPNPNLEQKLDIPWFDNMEPYKKALLIPVAADIASGKKVLPSQLLHDLPGLRNAYQKVTARKGPGEVTSKILESTLHCGAPVSKVKFASKVKVVDKANPTKEEKQSLKEEKRSNKEPQEQERQRIANGNISQISLHLAPGESANLNILNGKVNENVSKAFGSENYIFEEIEQAQNTKGMQKFTVTASPLNITRALRGGGRNTEQFQIKLGQIADGLLKHDSTKGTANSIAAYLKDGSTANKKKAEAQLKTLTSAIPELAKVLRSAVEAKTLIDTKIVRAPFIKSPSQRISVDLTARMNFVNNAVTREGGALNKIVPHDERTFFQRFVDFCKSGKDRTGYVQTKNTHYAVSADLGIKPNSKEGRENFKRQVAGGHTQQMAGTQGGTPGCFGIKDLTGFLTKFGFMSKKDRDDVGGILTQESAGYNNKIKVPKGKGAKETKPLAEKRVQETKAALFQAIKEYDKYIEANKTALGGTAKSLAFDPGTETQDLQKIKDIVKAKIDLLTKDKEVKTPAMAGRQKYKKLEALAKLEEVEQKLISAQIAEQRFAEIEQKALRSVASPEAAISRSPSVAAESVIDSSKAQPGGGPSQPARGSESAASPDVQADPAKPRQSLSASATPEKGVGAPDARVAEQANPVENPVEEVAKPALAGDLVCIGLPDKNKVLSLKQLNHDEQNNSASSDIDPITQAVRTEILEKQQAYILAALKKQNPGLALDEYDDNKANIRDLLNVHEYKIEELLKEKSIQKELRDIERKGYDAINTKFRDRFKDIEWGAQDKDGKRSIEIKGIYDKLLCTLTENTEKRNVKDPDGNIKGINCRAINFPNEVNSGAGPLHLQIAIRDEHGKDIEGAKFSVHYENGKLTEFSHPIPIKFLGDKDDAIGYTEINGKLAIFPITRGNYNQLIQQLDTNRGVQAGLGQGAVGVEEGKQVPQEPKTAKQVGGRALAQDFAVVPPGGEYQGVEANPQDKTNLEVPAQGAAQGAVASPAPAPTPAQGAAPAPASAQGAAPAQGEVAAQGAVPGLVALGNSVDLLDAVRAAAMPGNDENGQPLPQSVLNASVAVRNSVSNPSQSPLQDAASPSVAQQPQTPGSPPPKGKAL